MAALLGRMALGATPTPTVVDRLPTQAAVAVVSGRRCGRLVVAAEGGCVLPGERDERIARAPRMATRVMIPVGTLRPIGHPEVTKENWVRGPIVVDAMADHTRRVFRHVSTCVTGDAGCRGRPPPPPLGRRWSAASRWPCGHLLGGGGSTGRRPASRQGRPGARSAVRRPAGVVERSTAEACKQLGAKRL